MTDPLFTLRLRDASSALDFDLNLLATTAQGLINRAAPRVLVENPIAERRDNALDMWHWLETFQRERQWLAGREVVALADVADLLTRFRDAVAGLVVFDPAVPASSNVAVTLAAREGLAVTGPDGLAWLRERGAELPVRHDLRGRFQNKGDAHRWMIEHLVRGRTDLRVMSYVMDAWRRDAGGDHDGMGVEGMDHVIAHGGVAFDLSPWADEIPVDDPNQPLGQDFALWQTLFAAAAEARAGDEPLEVTGFPFWRHKYSDWEQAGGRRRPHEAEWEAVWHLTPFGAYLNPLIAPNMSFHRWAPLPERLTQPDPGPPPPLENKTYVCLHLGDFDGGFGTCRRLPALWTDPRRGELPLGWGINPNMARCYPDIVAHAFATRTPNDHFVADASSAGYVNPSRLSDAPAGVAMRESPLTLWERFCQRCYARLDYTLSPMVLDRRLPAPEVLDAFARFSPEGIAFILDDMRGGATEPVRPHLWRQMPVTQMHNLSCGEPDARLADVMRQCAADDLPDAPSFHLFRFEWKRPSFIFDTFAAAQRDAAPRAWVAPHPRQWFQLLREHLV